MGIMFRVLLATICINLMQVYFQKNRLLLLNLMFLSNSWSQINTSLWFLYVMAFGIVCQMRNWSDLWSKQLKLLTNYWKYANNYSLEFYRQSCLRRKSLIKTTWLLLSLSSSETIRKRSDPKNQFFRVWNLLILRIKI
jgi:hypothetical protein